MFWLRRFIKYYFYLLALLIVIMLVLSVPKAALTSPPRSAIILDQNGQFVAQVGGSEAHGMGYWPVAQIPPRIMQATLTLEDKRFWTHSGIDSFALFRAIWQNFSSGKRISGASTITMQVARMQNPGKRTYFKKLQEMFVALVMTLRYSRQDILKHYLRLVPYSNRSHGIAHAAYLYFNKPIEDLSWAEIAFLSAIPQAPGLSNPFSYQGRQRAQKRGAHLLSLMHAAKLMDDADYQLSQQQLGSLDFSRRQTRNEHFMHAIFYLDKQFRSGSLPSVIHTHLDSRLQSTVQQLSYSYLQDIQTRGADNIAVLISRTKDNAILAWSGSVDYFEKSNAGAIDYIRTPRSPGSTLKPFVYALAFEKDVIQANSILDDLPSRSRGILNADGRYLGPMLPRYALANSRNIPAINLVLHTGLPQVYDLLGQLDLHDYRHQAQYYGLGIAVGSMPTSLEQLVTAYSSLANDGIFMPLKWFKQKPSSQKKIFSRDVARLISLHLSDPMARLPSFTRMGSSEYPFPVAIKTGTSQGFRDAWTIAYSKEYIIGVWIGRADATGMKNLSGAASSSVLTQKILLKLHKNQLLGFHDLSFPKPVQRRQISLCRFNGYLANADCPQRSAEWLKPENIPQASPVQWVKIDKRNGRLAGDWTPANFLALRKALNIPNRYRNWAKHQGFYLAPTHFSELNAGNKVLVNKASMQLDKDPVKQFTIASPSNNSHFYINPHIPKEKNSINLHIDIDGEAPEVLWYVDGQPFQLVAAPYSLRWPLQPGVHRFQAKIPYSQIASNIVKVTIE